jgi:hypothetical protein
MEDPYMVQVPLDQDTVGTLADLAEEFSADGDRWTLGDVVDFLIHEFLGGQECDGCKECQPDEKEPMTN